MRRPHTLPLPGLCDRRHWPSPQYGTYSSSAGYGCVVTVNHREYQTDAYYPTEYLAKENAAMRAYLICRNFSVNDGMYPVGHDHGGFVQGIPTAIGTGRHSHRHSHSHNGSDTSSSPGSSPGRQGNPRSTGYGSSSSSYGSNSYYGSSSSSYGSSSRYRSMYPASSRRS
ncbi:hypothetical protein GJ744_010145 [Endocarpon pusillum]|uniref:DRBM domain-containing protein n=1 Tax=Endocarpon pusillum TaxID=364733 RepID=A0A8H7E5N8_9EURO|nr:hypothetical protein GJ744_010145 [Endocarpon pusillum]